MHRGLTRLALLLAALLTGCAPGPALMTSTRDEVAVEFPVGGSLEDASKLAREACANYGRKAEFVEVQKTATAETRVAKYRCVDPRSSAEQ